MNFQDLIKELTLLGLFEDELYIQDNVIHFKNHYLEINSDLSLFQVEVYEYLNEHNPSGKLELCTIESVDDVLYYMSEEDDE
jgi:hypothetical protein